MNKWKPLLMVLLLVGILASVSFNTVVAYLADGDSASNAMTIGGNNITIDEEFISDSITPGAVIEKKVRIRNEGPNDCYVRVRAVFSDSDVGQYADIDWNSSEWVYDSNDEYYYYKYVVEAGDFTSYLMTTIQMDSDIPEKSISDVDLIIYAESYQTNGYSTYQEAWADYQINSK